MGIIFKVFTNVTGYGSLVLGALSLTAGLYMLAELAEEYPTATGRILRSYIVAVICMNVILWVDGLPYTESLVAIFCHAMYYFTLSTFPFIQIMSFKSLAALIAIILSHYYWFAYFINIADGGKYSIYQILGFFITMVWAAPCGLLISLTINENVLPGSKGYPSHATKNEGRSNNKKGSTMYISIYDFFAGIVKSVTSASGSFASRSTSISNDNNSRYGGKKSY